MISLPKDLKRLTVNGTIGHGEFPVIVSIVKAIW